MGPFIAVILKIVGFLGGPNVGTLITGVTDYAKNKTNVAGQEHLSDNEAGRALGTKYFDSVDKANEIKAQNRPMYLVVFGLLAFATPAAILMWASCLDSVPLFGHVVGSWGIDIPPKFQVSVEKIIDSFFISAPVAAVGIGIATAFQRRKK